MNTSVKNTEGVAMLPTVEEKIADKQDLLTSPIWEKKKQEPQKRFTAADMWGIRNSRRRFSIYKK